MPSTGFLKVQTLTSRAELPVSGATVSVSMARAGGGRELLNVQRTDESGMTTLLSVPTPELSNALAPELPRGWTDVQIAANVQLLSNNHDPYDRQVLTCRPVRICKGAWIGAGASILPGVTVGRHAIVGAASVVTHDVEDYAVVAGCPAKTLRMRFRHGVSCSDAVGGSVSLSSVCGRRAVPDGKCGAGHYRPGHP